MNNDKKQCDECGWIEDCDSKDYCNCSSEIKIRTIEDSL